MEIDPMTKELMQLLDDIDNLSDPDLTIKRFDIFEKYGLKVTFSEGPAILGNMN